MCGILGFVGANTKANHALIDKLMLQLSLRGTHATGYAWRNLFGSVVSVNKPAPASDFQTVHLPCFDDVKEIRMIGHTRYSTSDLEYNQPIQMGETALVMNGVLSQEGPETWPRSKWEYQTKNDAEIALHYSLMGKRGDVAGSFAICELDRNSLLAYRNGYRPLYVGWGKDFQCVASTKDSLTRCGVESVPLFTGQVLDLVTQEAIKTPQSKAEMLDLQTEVEHGSLKSVV